jgi:hypothetical protein
MTYCEYESKDHGVSGVSPIDRLVTASLGFTLQTGYLGTRSINPIGAAIVPTIYMDQGGLARSIVLINKEPRHAMNVSFVGTAKVRNAGMQQFYSEECVQRPITKLKTVFRAAHAPFVRKVVMPRHLWKDMIVTGGFPLYWKPKNSGGWAAIYHPVRLPLTSGNRVEEWLAAWRPAALQYEKEMAELAG